MLDRFIAECKHSQLSDPKVAKEALYLLRCYPRITPPQLMSTVVRLGMPRNIETAEMLANWMMADGWVHYSVKPFAGQGMSAVNAYEPTPKWKAFIGSGT